MSASLSDIPVIVLSGGFGTRLSHVVSDVPKPMAPIGERPFLEYILDYLVDAGIHKVILATGYKAEVITSHFGDAYKSLDISYSHEESPLGTGGAIKQAFDKYDLEEAIVLNGDTYYPVNLEHLMHFHHEFGSHLTLSVKYMMDFDRYGTVRWNAYNEVTGFHEKALRKEGWINGGVYFVQSQVFDGIEKSSFSFETDILESVSMEIKRYVLPSPAYFIDIGVPEDYYRFESAVKSENIHQKVEFNSLFLDRDGVINKRIPGGYVTHKDEFEFLDGVLKSIRRLRERFDNLFVVTNQQGIGKQLMSRDDLEKVHDYMFAQMAEYQVRPDGVFYCPELAVNNPMCRKPHVGMALEAADVVEQVDWSGCWMIGDSTSDIEFGLRMGMKTILVGSKSQTLLSDYRCRDLEEAEQLLASMAD